MRSWLAVVVVGGFLGISPTLQAQCVGDCNSDGEVTVDEIVTMVNVALGNREVSACAVGDRNGDGDITVDEIIAAVNNLLGSCPSTGPGLGDRRFTFSRKSEFTAVLNSSFKLPLGSFRGQKNGEAGDAYLILRAGEPDENGVATIDLVDGSDYFFVQAQVANLLVCVRPLLPVTRAGVVQCNGGQDYSIALEINHHVGQLGAGGFTLADCLSTCSGSVCGQIEGGTQICSSGTVGELCRGDRDCDTATGAGDGRCGLGRYCTAGRVGEACSSDEQCTSEAAPGRCSAQATCTQGKRGSPCRNDADCDTAAEAADGQCGGRAIHPGVCNGPLTVSSLGEDSGPGSAVLAPVFGLQGLPVELSFEQSLPCGDEPVAGGFSQAFAFTTGTARAVVHNVSNEFGLCSDNSSCEQDSDCDPADGPGRGVCGHRLVHDTTGENFSCEDWRNPNGPGCFVLAAPVLHAFQGADLVTEFRFCGR
ncbi:MAG: hypothetical protein KatS3mg077_2439 [Candidatus Binatia bacterium]|nr:MAG: hypothetical protein KatS3mg077_2439 [Candidatus Binatia bacterium]